MDQAVKDRVSVQAEDRWNTEAMYQSYNAWKKDLFQWGGKSEAPFYPELNASHFDLTKVQDVKKLLDLYMKIDRHLSFVYTYAHLKHDEDVAEEEAKKSYMSAMRAFHGFHEESSWIEPALLQLTPEALQSVLSAEELKEYRVFLEKIVRLKPHTLTAEKEQLLASAGRALSTSGKAFRALNDADLTFPDCVDQEGNKRPLTHGTFSLYLKDKDRTLRESAFNNLHETFGGFENTFCELLEGHVQKALFYAKVRGYSSNLDASLFPHEIDTAVYSSLIDSAKKGLPELHKYLAFRKEKLGYKELHLYDMYVPIVGEVDMKMTYDEAVSVIIDSLAPMGSKYQETLKKGLLDDRWVDRYENKRKRSGAYSSGCYDSMPYILMNFHGTLQDVMTLAHEAGHSMHSFFSRNNQAYQDSDYSIFVAEVASTFQEELLFQALLKKAKSKEEKAFLISQKMDAIRATFFRQTMFAEFELALHNWVEKGVPLTPALLKEKYLELNREYFGPDVVIDSSIQWEWSRIPHFYANFYVYQYATGISAACCLARQVLSGDPKARDKYIEYISAGSSLDPLNVLKRAGVDMKTREPVDSLIAYFKELGEELEKTLNSQ